MTLNIVHKSSIATTGGVADSPAAVDVEYGELAVNYASADPAIFAKDSANTVVRLNEGPQTVTTAKIANNAVTTPKIENDAVTTAKILDDNVTTAKILDDNVTTDKIADSAVTAAKVAPGLLLPTGAITAFGGSTAPTGYLECNGQSTSGHAALAAVVGANVPDLRGEFIRGWDNGKGTDSGRNLGTLQYATATRQFMNDGTGSDTNTTNVSILVGQQFASEDSVGLAGFNGQRKQANGSTTVGSTTDNVSLGGQNVSTNSADKWITYRPRNIALMYIIKT